MKQLKKILPIILAAYIIHIGGGIVVANICCDMCETINIEHRHDENHNGENHNDEHCSHKHHSHECNENSCTVQVYHLDIDDSLPPINIGYVATSIFNYIQIDELININGEQRAALINYSSTAPPPLILTPRGYLNLIASLLI